jgi:ABC-type dipeptide/oligopeptide/nickel transport system ATPase subunit
MFPKSGDLNSETGQIRIVGEGGFDGKELTADYFEERVVAGDSGRPGTAPLGEGPIQRVLNLELVSKHLQKYFWGKPQPEAPPLAVTPLSFRIPRNDRLRYRRTLTGVALPLAVLDASAHRVEATVQDLYSSALETEGKSQNLKEEFLHILQKIDPGVQRLDLVQTGRVATRLQIKHEKTGVMPLSALGDGFRRALMIAVTIPTVRGGVLLIDELETALHVSVLKSVLGLLEWAVREYNVQVFATTHSLEAVDAVLATIPSAKEEMVGYHLAADGELRRAKRYSGDLWERLRFERGLDIR